MRRVIAAGAIVLLVMTGAARGSWETNKWEFLDQIQYTHFKAYRETKVGPYGLMCDAVIYDNPYNFGPISSVAGIGFKLASLCMGHYRGWISYEEAYEESLRLLKAFGNELSDDPDVFTRVNGWTYHFYNTADGTINWKDGISLLDHMLFIAGVITAGEYFKGTEAAEIAHRLYSETQWTSTQHGDEDYTRWLYAENLLAIIQAAAAPQHAKSSARTMWETATAGIPYHLPLYYWQFPHSFVDFRFRTDGLGRNHADIARNSILNQRQWCHDRWQDWRDGHGFEASMYTNWTFGLSACGSSTGYRILNAIDEYSCDSGTIMPIAIPGCMIYAGTETLETLKFIYWEYYRKGWTPPQIPIWSDVYGFANAYNIGQAYSGDWGFYNGWNACIDYGPNVLLLENYRLGTAWRYFMQNPYIATGMYTVGFGDVQNVSMADFTNAVNQFGGGIGSWSSGSASFELGTTVNPYVAGHFVRIEADSAGSGGWIDLGGRDQRGHAQVSFWARAHNGDEQVLVGIKDLFERENKVRLADYTDGSIPTEWSLIKIPIEAFCITGVVSNDIWPGNLRLLSFEFTNAAGGGIDIDYVAFERDTRAPSTPTGQLHIAHFRGVPRIRWEPHDHGARELVGYYVSRRTDPESEFARAPTLAAPAHHDHLDDVSFSALPGQWVEYRLQAADNAEPPNVSGLGPAAEFVYRGEKRTDVDWNNGHNPNVFGGIHDGYWGGAGFEEFDFVQMDMPWGGSGWARRSTVSAPGAGHYIDMNSGDAGDSMALAFYIRGAVGGESIHIGMKDTAQREIKLALDTWLPAGGLTTHWTRVVIPFADFIDVNQASLENLSFTHASDGTVYIADLCFLDEQRSALVNTRKIEAENHAAQYGAQARDFKSPASGREVLGESWGSDTNHFAEYDIFVDRDLDQHVLNMRYACGHGTGQDIHVYWNDDFAGTLACDNTGGWGDEAHHYAWTQSSLPPIAAGLHRLRLVPGGAGSSVNLDYFTITETNPWFRECEDYDTQTGSGGPDRKAGASGGEVLGMAWGVDPGSEAVYHNVGTRNLTNAWFHLWYALDSYSGRVVNVYVNDRLRAQLICAYTGGWGDHASDFERVSAHLGNIGSGPYTVRLAVPDGGVPVNLDCFSIDETPPTSRPLDTDGDGLGDRQEIVLGTDPHNWDTDGNGMSDGDEWLAGTDPNDPHSIFECWNIEAGELPAPDITLRWPSVTGRIYRVYYASNLLDAVFLPLSGNLAATPPENVWTDTPDESEFRRFYQIRVRQGF